MSSAANSALWRLVSKKADAVVPLSGGGPGYPFYCVHSISGDASSLQHLALRLGIDRQVYGFQIPAHRMTGDFPDSVEAIAEQYVDLLIAREPDRPLFLGGWSAGSFIALEMAQMLRRRGREVPLLVALDGFQYETDARKGQRWFYWNTLRNLPYWLEDRLEEGKNGRGLLHSARKRLSRMAAPVRRVSSAEEQGSGIEMFLDTSEWPDAQAAFVRSLFDTVERYDAKPYEGQVLVLAAKAQHLFRAGQVEATWRRISKSIEVVAVSGSHVTMLREPRVAGLAKILAEKFAKLDSRPSRERTVQANAGVAGAIGVGTALESR